MYLHYLSLTMKLKLFLLCTGLYFPLLFYAQFSDDYIKAKVDSAWSFLDNGLNVDESRRIANELFDIHKEQGSEKAQLNALQITGECYYYSPHIDSAVVWYQRAKAYSKEINNEDEYAHSIVSLGSIYSEMSEYEKAIEQFDESIAIRKSRNDTSDLIFNYLKRAWTNNMADKHKLALDDYLLTLELSMAAKDTFQWANALNGMAIVQKKQKNLEESESLFLEAIDLQRAIDDDIGRMASEGNLAMVYKSMGQYQRAYDIYPPLVGFYEEVGFDLGVMSCYTNMSICSNFLKDHLRAIKEAKMALPIALNNSQSETAADLTNELAIAYLKLNQLDSALFWAKESEVHNEKTASLEKELATAKTLSEIHEKLGNDGLALDNFKRYKNLNDKIFEQEKSKQVLELQTKYDTAKKEQELADFQSKADLDLVKKQALTAGLLLALLSLGIILNREGKRRKKAHELHVSELQRSELEKQRLSDQLEFKNRELVAKALHIAQKNEMLKEIQDRLEQFQVRQESDKKEVNAVIQTLNFDQKIDQNWDQFLQTFTESDAPFLEELQARHPKLSKNELRLSALIRMNLSTKDIAQMLNISDEGVKKARYRLRKKMELETTESLDEYILRLGLRTFSA